MGNFRLSSDRLTSCAIYPDDTIDILVSGDLKGGLGVMVIQPESGRGGGDGPEGRSCAFNVHAKQLNHVAFDNNNASKVFSCSEVNLTEKNITRSFSSSFNKLIKIRKNLYGNSQNWANFFAN